MIAILPHPAVRLALLLTLAGLASACRTVAPEPPQPPAPQPAKSVLRLKAACQAYSFILPWQKKDPFETSGMAVLIRGNRLLAPADLVRNHTFIELEKIDSGEKSPARVMHLDYEMGLAILAPEKPEYLQGMAPLEIQPVLQRKDCATAWQFEFNGTPLLTEGRLRMAFGGGLISYTFDIELPTYAPAPFGMPLLTQGKLSALCRSYQGNNRTLDAISGLVIANYLNDLDNGTYEGLPGVGFGFTLLDDPQLRAYIALPPEEQGVYVTYVRPGSPAACAGLKKADVVLAIDTFNIDRKAQYEDPDFGRLGLGCIINSRSVAGQVRNFVVWRDRRKQTIPVTLDHVSEASFPIPPNISDRGPDYIVAGGFIMQELSRTFLMEWQDWDDRAPQRLVYLERNQWENVEPGKKVVILSYVMPIESTQGYGDFNFQVIDEVNGKAIRCLADVRDALKTPISRNEGRFHAFRFRFPPQDLVLDADRLAADNAFIQKRFKIPALQRFHAEEK